METLINLLKSEPVVRIHKSTDGNVSRTFIIECRYLNSGSKSHGGERVIGDSN